METIKAEILNFADALKLCTFYEKLKQRKVDWVALDRLRVLYRFKEIDGVWQLTTPSYDFTSHGQTKRGFTAFANGGKIYSRESDTPRMGKVPTDKDARDGLIFGKWK